MKKRLSPLVALVGALGFLGACGLNISSGVEARDTWKRTYPMTAGASFEIRNTNGKIHITPADGDDAITAKVCGSLQAVGLARIPRPHICCICWGLRRPPRRWRGAVQTH